MNMVWFNSFSDGTIVCSEKRSVDMDALNLVASGEVAELCRCEYRNEKNHHHFIYDTQGLSHLSDIQDDLSLFDAADIIAAALRLVRALRSRELVLDNVRTAKDYILCSDEGYKFVYLPLDKKSRVSVRDFFIRLIVVIGCRDERVAQLLKSIRKEKDDGPVLDRLSVFVSMYSPSGSESEADTTVFGEGETSILDAGSDVGGENADQEGETTFLNRPDDSDEGFGGYATTAVFHDDLSENVTTFLTEQPTQEEPASEVREAPSVLLSLVRNSSGERIPIEVTPFTIGKDALNVDCVIDNSSVSRRHATIFYEEGTYFIVDNNSTNGTIIEGIRLQPGERAEIGNGYIISLGNESFQAYIERR